MASVSVNTSYDDGLDTSYCENFPYDVLGSTDVDADHCEEHGLHLIELDGSDLTITLNGNVDVNTVNGIDNDDRHEEQFTVNLTWVSDTPQDLLGLVSSNPDVYNGNIEISDVMDYGYYQDENDNWFYILEIKHLINMTLR